MFPSSDTLLEALNWRYATKVFDANRQIDGATWSALEQSLQLTASSYVGQWAANQVYIALGNLLTSAALLGVDTCAIEGFSPGEYDRILGLETGEYQSCVVCACGYRSAADKYASFAKVRYPAADLIEHR